MTKYRFFKKLPQITHIQKSGNVLGKILGNFLINVLLLPNKSNDRSMRGILFLNFACCEPLITFVCTVLSQLSQQLGTVTTLSLSSHREVTVFERWLMEAGSWLCTKWKCIPCLFALIALYSCACVIASVICNEELKKKSNQRICKLGINSIKVKKKRNQDANKQNKTKQKKSWMPRTRPWDRIK